MNQSQPKSTLQQEVIDFIESIPGINHDHLRFNYDGALKNWTLDAYMYSTGRAVEVFNEYWLNPDKLMSDYGLTPDDYQLEKRILSEKLGIEIIFVEESHWIEQNELAREWIRDFMTAGKYQKPELLD